MDVTRTRQHLLTSAQHRSSKSKGDVTTGAWATVSGHKGNKCFRVHRGYSPPTHHLNSRYTLYSGTSQRMMRYLYTFMGQQTSAMSYLLVKSCSGNRIRNKRSNNKIEFQIQCKAVKVDGGPNT